MNKNLVIGLLGAVILIGGGYYLFSINNPQAPVAQTPTTNTTVTTTTTVTNPPQAAAPTAVTDSGNVFVSNATALVTGKVIPNGAPTSYSYNYGTTQALGTQTVLQSVGSGRIQIPAPAYIAGLSANTTYFFRLSAKNAYGTATGATYSFTTNSTPAPQGVAPTANTGDATDVARTTSTANGLVNPNGWATSYWFEYGPNTDLGSATALKGVGSGKSALSASAQLSDLAPLTKYYFRLNAQNPYGTVTGSVRTFTTAGPAAPSAPTVSASSASAIATSSATMNGKVNPNGAVTTYWFEYSTDSLIGTILGSTTHTQTADAGTISVSVAAQATGLTRNTRYYYRLVAQNSNGTVRSDIANFRTKQ